MRLVSLFYLSFFCSLFLLFCLVFGRSGEWQVKRVTCRKLTRLLGGGGVGRQFGRVRRRPADRGQVNDAQDGADAASHRLLRPRQHSIGRRFFFFSLLLPANCLSEDGGLPNLS